MVWQPVTSLTLGNNWRYTQPVYGNIFRLKHSFSYPLKRRMLALICQANGEIDDIELFQVKRVYPKKEYDIYEFARPEIFASRRLGMRLAHSSAVGLFPVWQVQIEENYYDPDKHFVYYQLVPAYQWHVVHNMNRYPSVVVFNEVGDVMQGNVEYISTMEVLIAFNIEVSGKVVLD